MPNTERRKTRWLQLLSLSFIAMPQRMPTCCYTDGVPGIVASLSQRLFPTFPVEAHKHIWKEVLQLCRVWEGVAGVSSNYATQLIRDYSQVTVNIGWPEVFHVLFSPIGREYIFQ